MRGVGHQPFGDDDLLLVAARERRRPGRRSSPTLICSASTIAVDRALLLAGRSTNGPRESARERGDGEIVARSTSAASGLRSCGPRGSARCRLAGAWPAAGLSDGRRGLPSTVIAPLDAAQHAEQREQQLALALAVEAAEADDLARADGERDAVEAVVPAEAARPRAAAPGGGSRAAWADNCVAMSRPIISWTISSSLRAPLAKVSMWRPLRNTEQRVGQRLDLVHAVRDVEDATALRRCSRCSSA